MSSALDIVHRKFIIISAVIIKMVESFYSTLRLIRQIKDSNNGDNFQNFAFLIAKDIF